MRGRLAFIFLIMLFVVGCVHERKQEVGSVVVSGKSLIDGKALGLYDRFKKYWEYRLERKADKAFSLEAPHIQFVTDKKRYEAFVKWFAKGVEKAEIEPYRVRCEKPFYCCVDMKMHFVVEKKKKDFEGHDCWVKVGGKWWHLIKNPLLGSVL